MLEHGGEVLLPDIDRGDERAVRRDALQGRRSEGAPQAVDLVRDRTGHHEGNRQPAARGHGARLSDARL